MEKFKIKIANNLKRNQEKVKCPITFRSVCDSVQRGIPTWPKKGLIKLFFFTLSVFAVLASKQSNPLRAEQSHPSSAPSPRPDRTEEEISPAKLENESASQLGQLHWSSSSAACYGSACEVSTFYVWKVASENTVIAT